MHRQRRTAQKNLVPFGDEGTSDIIHTPKRISSSQTGTSQKKTKRLRRRQHIRKDSRFDCVLLGILFVAIALIIFMIAFAFVLLCSWIANPHTSIFGRKVFHSGIELDHDLYHRRYNNISDLYGSDGSDFGSESEIHLDNSEHDSLALYGTEVMDSGCSITVFLMDPRLPLLESTSPWFTLESIAAFLPDACVIIQTGKIFEPNAYLFRKSCTDR